MENNKDDYKLEVIYKKVKNIHPYENNSRTHSEEQILQIAESIKSFGFTNPILINPDNTVIAGHGRLEASKLLNWEEVPTITLKDLTAEQVRALVIADNKIAENAGWDTEILAFELQELFESGFKLDLTGFDVDELLDLGVGLGTLLDDINPEDADEVPEEVEDPVIKVGDLIEMNNHRLVCGDSTNKDNISRLMDGEKATMVFTDPPWNVNYGAVKEGNDQGYKPRTILNDFMGTEEFKDFMNSIFKNMAEHSVHGCMTYVVMSAQEWGNMMLTLASNEYHWSSTIIWNKDSLVLSRKDYHTKYEPIWYGWLGEGRVCPLKDRKQSDVWDVPRPKVSELHPTTKPVELVEIAVRNSSKPNGIVLDLFGGSGTTMIACENLGRHARMSELDPKYAQVIVERWCQYTSVDTIKINGKEVSWTDYRDAEQEEQS